MDINNSILALDPKELTLLSLMCPGDVDWIIFINRKRECNLASLAFLFELLRSNILLVNCLIS